MSGLIEALQQRNDECRLRQAAEAYAARLQARIRELEAQLAERKIIGYAVFPPEFWDSAALYSVSQKDEAYSAVARWKGCILSAVVLHPDSFTPLPQPPKEPK